jgi:hypothetical protein
MVGGVHSNNPAAFKPEFDSGGFMVLSGDQW